ncbi:hypothetical protein VNI00_018916 [Paramarasmius palmivorus]|uniref:Uncharacterized protein n=1 Tax=Paramarasmius palmivorus TaxID=297713 RepID=A0AAW0ATI5_9AGAR
MLGQNFAYSEAAGQLEQLTSDRLSSGAIENALCHYAKNIPDNCLDLTTSDSVNGHTWHLTKQTHEELPPEEMVFTLHGIIMQCDLPPIIRPYGRFVSPKHVQQRVLLTGINTPMFADAIQGLARVDGVLRQAIREEHPRTLAGETEGYSTVEVANRYFTSKKVAREEHHVGFTKEVDPKGILDDLRGEAFVHTEDNVVEYYQRQVVNDDQRFRKIHPSRITKGDIVEVQLTVNLVELASGKGRNTNLQYITKLVLRSITLLDKAYSESIRMSKTPGTNRVTLKRKIGHTDEETRDAERRIKRMANR